MICSFSPPYRLIRLSLAQLAMILSVPFTAHSSCLNLKAESVWRCMRTIASSSLKGQKRRMREFTELYLRIQLEKIRLISQSKLLVSEGKKQPEHERILSLLKLTLLKKSKISLIQVLTIGLAK